MKLTKSKLKEIIREELLKEQALFPVKVDMQVDFTGTESNEEKFVADIEKAIQGVIDNSGVNITWTVNDYSMNEGNPTPAVQKKLIKIFKNDPLYKDVIMSKNSKEFKNYLSK